VDTLFEPLQQPSLIERVEVHDDMVATVEDASELPTALGEPLRRGDRDVERLLALTAASGT
jgi:hypothetical protein